MCQTLIDGFSRGYGAQVVQPDPAPEVPDPAFWNGRPARSRARPRRRRRIRSGRVGRARTLAAIVLVAGLAAAWITTSQRSSANEPTAVAASDAPDESVVTGAPITGSSAEIRRMRSLLPEAARCAETPSSVTEATCSIALVAVHYELVGPADALRAAYLGGVLPELSGGSATLAAGSGAPACARGAEDERAWSRPAEPKRAVGRYACRIEQGRAAMWWTVDDRGLLAHATAPDADLISLFAWWRTHSER